MVRSLLTNPSARRSLTLGLGALAVIAAFAALLLFSGDGALASNAPPPVDDGGSVSERPVHENEEEEEETPTPTPEPTETATPEPTPTPTRVHATPEPCPANPADVVSSGHYALFEVYWDPNGTNEYGHNLTGNLCPPIVKHIPHTHTDPKTNEEVTTYTAQRSDPTFKVSDSEHAVISTLHVNETKKHSLAATVTRTKTDHNYDAHTTDDMDRYPFAYPELGHPSSSEETTNDLLQVITTETYNRKSDFGDHIWALPYCEPEYGYVEADGDLCLGFSAGLLATSDWRDPDADPEAPGQIQYHLESVREPGIDADDRGYVFVYYPHDEEEDEDGNAIPDDDRITWRSDYTNADRLYITPGTYQHRHWAFTKPGRYQLQAHALGYPSQALKDEAGIDDITTTSVVRFYNFHVGLMADLSVAVTADDATPDPGDTVTFTVTATNAGPDEATATKVSVELPVGLDFVSATPADGDGTYDTATDVWTIGDMDAPTTTTENGKTTTTNATATLVVKATVDNETHGQELETDATIHATETIGSSTLRELDPDTSNNNASANDSSATVTVSTIANTDPRFGYIRYVNENTAPGGAVGSSIYVADPNSGDTLTYTLGGADAAKFDVSPQVHNNGVEIVVAKDAYLNFEDKAVTEANLFYNVTLSVSDGKDQYGNDDDDVDHTVPVIIDVSDVAEARRIVAHLVAEGDKLTTTYDTQSGDPTSYSATVGSTVTLSTILDLTPLATNAMEYSWTAGSTSLTSDGVTQSVTAASAGAVTYQVAIRHKNSADSDVTGTTASITITWAAASE